MESFCRRPFVKGYDRPPLRGMVQAWPGRNLNIPYIRPPLREHRANFGRESLRETPIDVDFEADFQRGVSSHSSGMTEIDDKDARRRIAWLADSSSPAVTAFHMRGPWARYHPAAERDGDGRSPGGRSLKAGWDLA